MEENSIKGLTKVQNARVNNNESRELKHFRISLDLRDALATIVLMWG
jgi:hypothetical protein